MLIGDDKALDHIAVKGFAAIDHMVLKAQPLGDGARVLNVRHVVTGPALAAPRATRVVQAHGGANAFVPLLKQQVGGHAGVDAAAHGDQHALLAAGSVRCGCCGGCVGRGRRVVCGAVCGQGGGEGHTGLSHKTCGMPVKGTS